MKSYQVTQIRYEGDSEVWDSFPILFATPDEARARVKRDGLDFMFEHVGDYHFLAEVEDYREGVQYTGNQFPLEA